MSETTLCHSISESFDEKNFLSFKKPASGLLNEEVMDNDLLLQKISPLFSVRKTKYGGRGCFASQKIAKDDKILSVNLPVGCSVVRPFRKEVCTWCFHYDDGRSMKFKIMNKIYFCSEKCTSEFSAHDPDGLLASAMCKAEDLFIKCAGEISENDVPADENELSKVIDKRWRSVELWEQTVFRLKPSKRSKYYPVVSAEDYTEIRYVLSTLHNMSQSKKRSMSLESVENDLYLTQMTQEDTIKFEIEAFEILQSSELDKVKRYPYLMVLYMNVYKFVRLVCPESWLPLVTPQNIRDIIGRNLTNAFGIWSHTTKSDEEREFFGFGVYPSASFFNHSCDFNIKKIRTGASYDFVASRDILQGEELCISYGINGDESVEERRASLREWFFVCGCAKCTKEAAGRVV